MFEARANQGAWRPSPWVLPAAISLFAAASGSCTRGPPEPASELRATATIRDIMRSMIDPSADAIWDSVVTESTLDGIEITVPETEEDWDALRRHVITIVEATNLLLMDGRRVASPEERAAFPGVDLEPEEVEALITQDRATWNRLAGELHDTGLIVLEAVEARSVDGLLEAGNSLDVACENCHGRFWYPGYGEPTAEPPVSEIP